MTPKREVRSKDLEGDDDKNHDLTEEESAQHAESRLKDLAGGKSEMSKRHQALDHLIQYSKVYAQAMLSQMVQEEEAGEAGAQTEVTKKGRGRGRSKKSTGQSKLSTYFNKKDVRSKTQSQTIDEDNHDDDNVRPSDVGFQKLKSGRQPTLVTGGAMKKYQLEGLEWLKSLYENGLNGILADEMGLGKTLQTISFLAFLREVESYGPHLIVAPLSTTANWMNEFAKWTESIPTILYGGNPTQRAEIREKNFKSPGGPSFPIVVTSYDIVINDRKYLSRIPWKFIVVDEGHRLKNLESVLLKQLQALESSNRLLITGTPLQNNLAELWSLLHFLMPDIFDKFGSFEAWFDFSALKDKDTYDQIFSQKREKDLIASLHEILKPFLLRRVKLDVETKLPKKREYVLFAPLTTIQKELYCALLDGASTSRSYLEEKVAQIHLSDRCPTPDSLRSASVSSKKRKLGASSDNTPNKSLKSTRESTPVGVRRRSSRKDYSEISDMAYFATLEDTPPTESESDLNEDEDYETKVRLFAKKMIGSKKLLNTMMQLRLCCNSPYNFYNPYLRPDGSENDPDETLVSTSGKMLLLDTLLRKLFEGGHKVLIFSQFQFQLDLLARYAELRRWKICRIDGSVSQASRAEQIDAFHDPKSDYNIFLLSTRAGGQGINLTAADTVILFDSDWNPQQDLQAQDRIHRIGQTRNCLIYRFATQNTIEQRLLEQAEAKRRLEKLVIKKGGLKASKNQNQTKDASLDELRNLLRKSDGQIIDLENKVLSDRDLEILTDRSDEAYSRAEKGQDQGDTFRQIENQNGSNLFSGLKT